MIKYKRGKHPNSHIDNHGGGFEKGHIVLQSWKDASSIANKGKVRRVYTPLLEETKLKLSQKNRGRTPWNKGLKTGPQSEKTRLNTRLARINYIKLQMERNGKAWPVIGNFEKPILDYIEKTVGYNIIPQYEFRGFFIDGYCPALNLAIEIDEPHHQYKRLNDGDRQMEIEKYLKCTFLRIPISNYIYNKYKGG